MTTTVEEGYCPHCGKPSDLIQCVDCEKWFSEALGEIALVRAEYSSGSYYQCWDCRRADRELERE